jgi:transcriptional regulator with GAF, ATPase, and Fis domain
MTSYFEKLVEFCKSIFASADIEKLLPIILDLVIDETHAKRSKIVLYGDDGEMLFNRGRRRHRSKSGNLDQKINDDSDSKISRTLVATVWKSGEVVVSPNAMADRRFIDPEREIEEQTIFGILSVACAPLRFAGHTFGVLYIDDRDEKAKFTEDTGILLQGIADLIAEALKISLDNTLEQRRQLEIIRHETLLRRKEIDALKGYGEIVGNSPAMQKVYGMVDTIKDKNVDVLILGETGTGKGLVARTLHEKSERNKKPYFEFDCATTEETLVSSELFGHVKGAFTGAFEKKLGYLEVAEGGTLFLDEIGNLTIPVQKKLLKFLDNKEFTPVGSTRAKKANVRLIFATNKDLRKLVEQGQFMHDLFERIHGPVTIELPPLREREDDIIMIAIKLLDRYNKIYRRKMRFSEQAIDALRRYHFPGNIRELKKIVEHAVLFSRGEDIFPHNLLFEALKDTRQLGFGDEHSIFESLQDSSKTLNTKYLPENYRAHQFIWGKGPDDAASGAIENIHKAFHDTLLVSVKKAFEIPLKTARDTVATAFERNFIIAKLRASNGNVTEASKSTEVDKKTFHIMMRRHGLKREWFVE